MNLKEYINHLEVVKNNRIRERAVDPKESLSYSLGELAIAMTELWINVCKSFVGRGNITYETKEKKMTNKEFLKRASKLQKEFKELYRKTGLGLVAIRDDCIQVTAIKFNVLEGEEGMLQHVSKKLDELNEDKWDYKAMTPDGVKIIAVEWEKK